MAETKVQSSGGIGFMGLLAILFIGLKLGGVIDWSWVWVMAPVWGPIVLVLAIMLVIGAVLGIVAAITAVVAACSK